MEKSKVLQLLHEGWVKLEFEKLSGETRLMTATLNEGDIPQATKTDQLSQKKVRSINEEVMPVWDVSANGWRSFRWDKLKTVDGEAFVYGA